VVQQQQGRHRLRVQYGQRLHERRLQLWVLRFRGVWWNVLQRAFNMLHLGAELLGIEQQHQDLQRQ